MKYSVFLLCFSCLILLGTFAQSVTEAEILETCPNCGDYEYVKVRVTCDRATLTDGEGKIQLSKGLIIVTKNSTAFLRKFGFYPDVEAQKVNRRFMLSNQGEEILLLCNGSVEDKFAYGKYGQGITSYTDRNLIYFRNEGIWDFRYADWTNFTPVSDEVKGKIVIFPNDLKIDAEESVVLVSYILTNGLNLKELARNGVRVEIYLDSSPVGGIPVEEAELVKELKPFAEIHFLSSDSYKNFHYKFAVIDGKKVIITTENWKTSNRGYMIELESEKIASFLLDVIGHDRRYSSSPSKISELRGFKKSVIPAPSMKFEGGVEVFILPDSNPTFDLISSSKRELLIEVPYMDLTWFGTDELLYLIESACKNNSKVRILLDSRHSKEKNEKLIEFLNQLAKEKGYNLEAKLIALKGFESLHGKMIYSDGRCMITSANFNEYGFKLNREVGVIIESKEACEFLKKQFYEDWKDRFELADFPESLPQNLPKNLPKIHSPFDFSIATFILMTIAIYTRK
ncbi:MAG: phosphatidylserine/phosphatidylglycerophosphate/cardiolipin synthase family protein [Archaeoglobus sp.]|nr:phosphatidylserine/phosphatidylglycerophosphate/cardiolipin synthase family protein [Archaeoglobus sp.]